MNNLEKSIEKIEEIKLDEFNNNIHHFINFFQFYFKDRYGYKHIFEIDLEDWRGDLKNNNVVRKFLDRLVVDKVIQFMFSNERGVIMIYFELGDSYDAYNKALNSCDGEMRQILKNLDES